MKIGFPKKKLPEPRIKARRRCDMVVIFAASDGEWLGIEELLDSCSTYLNCDYQVLALDDATTDGTHERLLDKGLWVIRNPEKLYLWGLQLTLGRGFQQALDLFDAPYYLKIDPDALIIGHGFPEAVRAAFEQDERIGLLGTYHLDWNGERRDLSYWRERMLKAHKDLGTPYRLAQDNGYEIGDGVQGGAYVLSRPCLAAIAERGWFGENTDYLPPKTRGQRVAEDSLIAMLTYAAGYRAGEFGGPNQSLGIWDVGLPMPPDELVRQNRLVTHAMKYMDEPSLAARAFFKARRAVHKSGNSGNE